MFGTLGRSWGLASLVRNPCHLFQARHRKNDGASVPITPEHQPVPISGELYVGCRFPINVHHVADSGAVCYSQVSEFQNASTPLLASHLISDTSAARPLKGQWTTLLHNR